MAYVPVCRTIMRRFGGAASLRMAVSKAVGGGRSLRPAAAFGDAG